MLAGRGSVATARHHGSRSVAHPDRTLRRALPALLTAVFTVVTACSPTPLTPPPSTLPSRTLQPVFAGSPELGPPNLTDDGPGSLIEAKPLADHAFFDQINATAVSVRYRSTLGVNGAPTEVTGVVAAPPGTPPRGGWPIMVIGHDVTGVDAKCAPSLAPDLFGYNSFMGVMLSRGYVVALTDYQGLGVPGQAPHSLLDATTLGNDMIDIARATRRAVSTASTRWAAFGYGEGGTASWAATQRATSYGAGMELVGGAALAPLADLSSTVAAAQNATLNAKDYRTFMTVVEDLAVTAGLNRDDYRSGAAKDHWDELVDCAPADAAKVTDLYTSLRPADLTPANPGAAARLQDLLSSAALPLPGDLSTDPPLLVMYATADPALPLGWVNSALVRACVAGAPIEVVPKVGDTSTTTETTVQEAIDWLENRFGGQTIGSKCQGLG